VKKEQSRIPGITGFAIKQLVAVGGGGAIVDHD
jgi:hypothetical protein